MHILMNVDFNISQLTTFIKIKIPEYHQRNNKTESNISLQPVSFSV